VEKKKLCRKVLQKSAYRILCFFAAQEMAKKKQKKKTKKKPINDTNDGISKYIK